MEANIKDVAEMAGVSIATVSHVINRTRYVKPELVEKVEKAMVDTGYIAKVKNKKSNLKLEKKSTIIVIIPEIGGTVFPNLVTALSKKLMENGYIVSMYLSFDDIAREKKILQVAEEDDSVAGIILVPANSNCNFYSKFNASKIPIICLERNISNKQISSVISDNISAAYLGTKHLTKSGHEKIILLLENREHTTVYEERLLGYKNALKDSEIKFDEESVISLDFSKKESECEKMIADGLKTIHPTAVLACGNRLTLILLRTLQKLGLEWPKDISVVGFEDEEWCDLLPDPLTTIKQNTEEMTRIASKIILEQIENNSRAIQEVKVPVNLEIRKSTQMIGKGPFGEKAISPDLLVLSEIEKQTLRSENFKVGISFHYGGSAWERLHEKGIRDTLSGFGIAVTSVTDANFDPELQILQLEGLRMQKVDAVIAIPVNDEITSDEFKKLSKETKLIFMSNVPVGMKKEEYASCVSVNERENGYNAGVLVEKYFEDRKNVKVGIIAHGSPFYGTHLRDLVAKQTMESYDNLEIVATDYFYQMNNAYEVCKKMVAQHPHIEALYISWDEPALQAIKALKELERTDIKIVTTDLDHEIAKYLASEDMVVGLSAQRPYEQGVAVALATAKALLGEGGYQYIGVPPYVVQSYNLIKAWKDIFHEHASNDIIDLATENLRK